MASMRYNFVSFKTKQHVHGCVRHTILQKVLKVLTIHGGSDDMNSDYKGISPPPNLISH